MTGGGSSTATSDTPAWYQIAGLTLAMLAGFFTGCSMILQKKGLLDTRKVVLETGNEFAYLKSGYWWCGMFSLALGEVANFVAYAFSPAILVAPLMAISVVVSAIMSVIYLDEKLNFTATAGIILCLIGSIIIVLHAPSNNTTQTLPAFFAYVLSPGFLVYAFFCALLLAYLVFRLGPRYGHVHPAVYLVITALGGAFLVCSAQGLGASILYSITNWQTDNQFLHWEFYPLAAFVVATVIFQVNYLNKALACFSASIVTPLNYVFFSTFTIVTSSILYKGFNVDSVVIALTIVMGFLVIVVGVALLFQYNLKMSKLALMSRHIEDINDEDVIVETPADDNPFKLMNEVFPVDAGKVSTSTRVRPIATRTMGGPGGVGSPTSNDENPEHYVRPLDPEEAKANEHMAHTLIVPNNIIPQVSLSQQIQQRTDMMGNEEAAQTSSTLPVVSLSSLIPVPETPVAISAQSGGDTNQVIIEIPLPPQQLPSVPPLPLSAAPSRLPPLPSTKHSVSHLLSSDIPAAKNVIGDMESVYGDSEEVVEAVVGIGISVQQSWQPPGFQK